MKKNIETKYLIFFTLVMIVLDQITKYIFLKIGQVIVPNEPQNNGYYILVSIVIVIMLIRYMANTNSFIKSGTRVVLSFAIAGALGNVIDRIFRGYVISFIKLGDFININLAYIYIAITWVGMAAILTKNSYVFLNKRKVKGLK